MEPIRLPSFRRAMYQVHLWTGLVLGLYLLMLSVTGSALVYRLEMNRLFETPAPRFDADQTPMPPGALADAARRAYPGYAVGTVGTRISRHRPVVTVRLTRGTERLERLFDPYTGRDLGDAMSRVMRTLNWLAQLHDELLLGETGRTVNGIGSGFVGVLVITGVFVWWPAGWSPRPRNAPPARRPLDVRLHRFLGIWGAALTLLWAISGVYLAFPDPFDRAAYAVSGNDLSGVGYEALTWMAYLHFGRFSAAVQLVWLVVGLLPAVLVVTGVVMWWIRKVRGHATRSARTTGRATQTSTRHRRRWVAASLVLALAYAVYTRANYREEQFVDHFLDTVAAGHYRDAHAMWSNDQYTFDRFLADWGERGRHTAGARPEVIDSATRGPVVTVYVRTGNVTPVALEVDKETMLLSYGPTTSHGPVPEPQPH